MPVYESPLHRALEMEKKVAVKIAKARRHVLGRWQHRVTSGSGYLSMSSCQKCGAILVVNTAPGKTTGNAIFYNCKGDVLRERILKEQREWLRGLSGESLPMDGGHHREELPVSSTQH